MGNVSYGKIKITLTTLEDEATHCIQIYNSGELIPEYAEARLFERFYSLPRPDGSPKSTGLGLAIVREVVKLHGGDISLFNADNMQGVVAELVLPSGVEVVGVLKDEP